MLSVSAMAHIHEMGTGVAGPIRAPHLIAELIADSGMSPPGDTSHFAMSLLQGIVSGPMQYPVPSRLPVGPLIDADSGENQFFLLA